MRIWIEKLRWKKQLCILLDHVFIYTLKTKKVDQYWLKSIIVRIQVQQLTRTRKNLNFSGKQQQNFIITTMQCDSHTPRVDFESRVYAILHLMM